MKGTEVHFLHIEANNHPPEAKKRHPEANKREKDENKREKDENKRPIVETTPSCGHPSDGGDKYKHPKDEDKQTKDEDTPSGVQKSRRRDNNNRGKNISVDIVLMQILSYIALNNRDLIIYYRGDIVNTWYNRARAVR